MRIKNSFALLTVFFVLGGIVSARPFDQVIFSENFNNYPADKSLPKGPLWTRVEQKPAKHRFAYVRTDEKNVFGKGKDNRFLQVMDQDSAGAVRIIAANIPALHSAMVRLSFDAYEPSNELDGSLAIKVGKENVDRKKAETVNGMKLQDGRVRPGKKGAYTPGAKFHVDVFFNESGSATVYNGPDGIEYSLASGSMDMWLNGRRTVKSKVNDRDVTELTAITSLRIETFSSSMQEVWFDNIEIAVPIASVAVDKKKDTASDNRYLMPNITPAQIDADHKLIKKRYIRFLTGTERTFSGRFGAMAATAFLRYVEGPIKEVMQFDFTKEAGKTFHLFENEPGYEEERAVYSALLEKYILALAYGYTVKAPGNPYYRNPEVLKCYLQCLEYLYSRGVRAGMTFHYNKNRMEMDGAPKPVNGAGNLVKMELRMGAYCQSVLLMEPYFRNTSTFHKARALVRHLEMLGKTSGHVRYYVPFTNPPEFKYRAQSDAIQNYSDTTLVSALLETDTRRRGELLLDARRVYTDSLKVIPGWADTIKPDFTGYHHRGIYGNAYTGGFIPQAAFGVYLLADTHYSVLPGSVENVRRLIETYRLYCQKYAMPFGIRGRMPTKSDNIKIQVFPGILIYASSLGLNDTRMKGVFARLWDPEQVGIDFLFNGGRGKIFRGMYCLDMLEDLLREAPVPESNPNGFWYKPYGGLAIHRRADWMVAVKGHSKYIWDYENGSKLENVYGQYFSHGSLTIFAQGQPVNDIDSGYNLNEGWDWYRMPGTTAVHFPIKPQKPLAHRQFSSETFLGGVSADGQNGIFGMVLNRKFFPDGTRVDLKAYKSVFFVDDFILMLGSGISGGDGVHPVETTLFQSYLPEGTDFQWSENELADPAGNRYYVPAGQNLRYLKGRQRSYRDNGKDPTEGNYAVAWFDHGLQPKDAGYEAGIGIRGAAAKKYQVVRCDNQLHQVRFPDEKITGYVFFQPLETDDPIIGKVSDTCLIMAKEKGRNLLLGVANPDLNLVDRDVIADFKFINHAGNQYLPSRPKPVDVTVKGQWKLVKPSEKVKVIFCGEEKTVLKFNCIHGMDIRVELVRG